MNKKYSNSYWKDVPDDLRLMCLAEFRGNGHYCTEPVLHLLLDRMNYCDSDNPNLTPYQVLKWIDVAFEACLFPLAHYERDWKKKIEWIEKILNRADELVARYTLPGAENNHKFISKNRDKFSITEFSQRLNVFFCILYMYKGEWRNYRSALHEVIADSERNVKYLISCKEPTPEIILDDWSDYLYVGTNTWEPICFLGKEMFMKDNAGLLFIQAFKDYIIFLESQKKANPESDLANILYINAENGLNYLCNQLSENMILFPTDLPFQETNPSSNKDAFETLLYGSKKIITSGRPS